MHEMVKIAPGVVRSFDGVRAIYTGTAEALIAAGIVEADQLPGEGRNGRGMCFFNSTQIVAKKVPRGTLYEVRLALSEERLSSIEAERLGSLARRPRQSEVCVPLAPVQSHLWPFPASYGRQLMGAHA